MFEKNNSTNNFLDVVGSYSLFHRPVSFTTDLFIIWNKNIFNFNSFYINNSVQLRGTGSSFKLLFYPFRRRFYYK